jgi:hypothetical protein
MATYSMIDLEPVLREIVFPQITPQFEEDDTLLLDRIGEGKGERINSRGVRIPLYIFPNASNGHFSEAGAFPVPGKPIDIESKVYPTRYGKGFEMSGDVLDTIDQPESLLKGLTQLLSRANQSARKYMDVIAYGDGTGQLGTVQNVVGTTITFSTAFASGLTVGSRNVLENGRYNWFSSTGTPRVATNPVSTAQSKDDSIAQVTFDLMPTDPVTATDYVTYENSNNKAPHGLAYMINNDVGNFQGVSRTTYPKTRSGVFNASGQALTIVLIAKAKKALRVRTGKSAENITMVSHPAQKESLIRQGYNLQRFAGKGETFDPSFKDAKAGGSEWIETNDCWDDRVYFLDFSTIHKYTLKEYGPYNADGLTFRMFFATGSGSDKYTGWIGAKYEYGCVRPQANQLIKNLSLTDLATGTASWS